MRTLLIVLITAVYFLTLTGCHNFDYDTDFLEGGTLVINCYSTAGTITNSSTMKVGIFLTEESMNGSGSPPYGGDVSMEGGQVIINFETDQELYIGGFYDADGDNMYDASSDPSNAYGDNPVIIDNNDTVTINFYVIN